MEETKVEEVFPVELEKIIDLNKEAVEKANCEKIKDIIETINILDSIKDPKEKQKTIVNALSSALLDLYCIGFSHGVNSILKVAADNGTKEKVEKQVSISKKNKKRKRSN